MIDPEETIELDGLQTGEIYLNQDLKPIQFPLLPGFRAFSPIVESLEITEQSVQIIAEGQRELGLNFES